MREDPDEDASSRDVEMSWSVETYCSPSCSVNLGRSIPTTVRAVHQVPLDDTRWSPGHRGRLLTVSVLEAGAST